MKQKLLLATALLASMVSNVCAQTDGDYYLYDETNKVFLSRGGAWGTEATVDKYGVPIVWTSATGNIRFKDMPSNKYMFTTGTNSTEVFTDGNATTFTFVSTTDGYFLQNSGKTSYARHDAGTYTNGTYTCYREYVNMTTEAANAIVWTLKTKEERDAIINAYPTTNKTTVISTAGVTNLTTENFETDLKKNYANKEVLTIAPSSFSVTENTLRNFTYKGNITADSPREAFQAACKFKYSATSLKKGIYKITIYGFQRNGENADCMTLHNNGYDISTSFLTANNEQVRIKSWAEECTYSNDKYNPNSLSEAGTNFSNGKYANTVYTYVGEDGNLDLTVTTPELWQSYWFIFGNTEVTYYEPKIQLNESESNTITDATDASVNLTRTIKANTWNTIVLPFSLTDAQVKAAFGSDAQVATFSESSANANNIIINLNTTSEGITANIPALIKTSTAGTTYTFDNVNIVAGDPIAIGTNVDFVGSYKASTTVENGNYFLSDNKIYPSIGATTIDGFRAYFKVKNGVSNAAAINLIFDSNITTGMTDVNTVNNHKNAVRYNLNGQRISSTTKGLYIENGKKMVQ